MLFNEQVTGKMSPLSGAKSGLNSSDIEDRYRAMSASAQTRSLLSIGLSCFKLTSTNNDNCNSSNNNRVNTEISETNYPNNGHIQNAEQHQKTNGQAELSKETQRPRDGASSSTTLAASALNFESQTFNIFTLCQDDFMVEPDSLMFLVGHGFDFNLQFEKGLPYHRGADSEKTQVWAVCLTSVSALRA